jgi:alcohol dehydrogenase class IV
MNSNKPYYNPVKIIETNNWLTKLNYYINELSAKNILIITTNGNRTRLGLDNLFLNASIFSESTSNPSFRDCQNVFNFCKNKSFDSIVAIGGGSAMDLAKVVIAHLSIQTDNVMELISFEGKYPKKIPAIFIPTNHGTASEVTMWGTIWNMQEKKKFSISHPDLYPKIAILDGSLTTTLPLGLSLITTMDALSHSFESIWNKNHNKKSTEFATTSISSILINIEHLKKNTSNVSIRNKLLSSSATAGLAFSNTKTAAAHSISYPLTIYFGIPHGIASSLTLIPLLDINYEHITKPINTICENLNINFLDLREKIKKIPSGLLNYRLRDWGVQKKNLPKLAEMSFTKGRMENNIVDLDRNDVLKILEQVY